MSRSADTDDILSVAASDFSLVSDVQDAQIGALDGQRKETTPPDAEVLRELKPVHHPLFSFEDDLVALQARPRYIATSSALTRWNRLRILSSLFMPISSTVSPHGLESSLNAAAPLQTV
jgi:hypothetical protein